MKKILLSFLALAIALSASTQRKNAKPFSAQLTALEVKMNDGLEKYNVPGGAIAIVYNNEIILSKGFGLKDAATKEPVTENSSFAIASNSKAFTSAALAICVDRGLLKWEDKVQDFLPEIKLYDPYVSANLTVRDLISHRQGFETFAGDLIWYGTNHSRNEILRRWRFVEPKYGFRTTYGYCNIAFLAAGQIVEKVTGKSWDAFVKDEIFLPLGMKKANTSITAFEPGADIASPHNTVKEKNIPIPYVNWDNIGPAGSINACVNELSQWMMLQLNNGTLGGKKYWDEKRTYEMWEYNINKPVSKWQRENMPSRHANGYGMGWELMEYGGHKIVSHGGGYDGMISKTILVPDMNLGFVILTNSNNSLPSAMGFEFLDLFLGVKGSKNWVDEFAPKPEAADVVDGASEWNFPVTSEIEGIYRSEMYGDVEVIKKDDGYKIDFKPTELFKGTLVHLDKNVYVMHWSTQMMLPSGKIQFISNMEGEM
jgi:CubicO group peptidase (beta-lactamase class C family)